MVKQRIIDSTGQKLRAKASVFAGEKNQKEAACHKADSAVKDLRLSFIINRHVYAK